MEFNEEEMICSAPELFGITEEQANDVMLIVKRTLDSNKTIEAVAEALDLHRGGLFAFKAFAFGRLAEKNDSGTMAAMKMQMLMKLRAAVGDEKFKEAFEKAFGEFKMGGRK